MQIITPTNTVIEGDATLSCLRVSPRWSKAQAAYHLSARTGLVATPGIGGVLFAFQWFHWTYVACIELLRVRAMLTTPPTAAQEWGLQAVRHRSASPGGNVGFAGGTILDPTQAGGFKKRNSDPLSAAISASGGERIAHVATTSALSSVGTIDASPFISDMAWELAAGAAVPRSRVAFEKDYTSGNDAPLTLQSAEAVAIAVQPNAIGAAGVLRMSVELAWYEVDPKDM